MCREEVDKGLMRKTRELLTNGSFRYCPLNCTVRKKRKWTHNILYEGRPHVETALSQTLRESEDSGAARVVSVHTHCPRDRRIFSTSIWDPPVYCGLAVCYWLMLPYNCAHSLHPVSSSVEGCPIVPLRDVPTDQKERHFIGESFKWLFS